jgi:NADH-quinone oxidoreductase subunit E
MDTDKGSKVGDIAFSPETEAEFQKLLQRYPNRQACVLPALFLCQEEFGYVSVQSMEYVAQRLDVPPAKVLSVATFYTMFRRHPVGEHHICVCTGPPCALVGSDRVLRFFEERLGVKVGQTTPDKKFTLDRSECLASCGTAPMLECDGHYYENLTEERLEELLAEWSKNGS